MSENWTISVGSRVYGPYSVEQMQAFHAEGRLATHSLVARAGEEQFHPAGEDTELAPLFGPVAEAAPQQPEPQAETAAALDEEIHNLGHAYRFMPQSCVLTSEASLNTIRHALMQKLGKLDTIFVVDTIHDRAAWFNFGPEADIRVRRMWARTPEGARKAG